MERLQRQIQFILESDRLKHILRQTYLLNSSRHENSAEHSWQLALMAMVLAEYSPEPLDLMRVLKMLLIHDLVEIDAGDTYCYDKNANEQKLQREEIAAHRIYGLLPEDQAAEFLSLWREFERQDTAEARFAAALDRLMPMLHNYHTQGKSWLEHGITAEMVKERNRHIAAGAPQLWTFAEALIQDAVEKGFLK